jgi:hypothetical protein
MNSADKFFLKMLIKNPTIETNGAYLDFGDNSTPTGGNAYSTKGYSSPHFQNEAVSYNLSDTNRPENLKNMLTLHDLAEDTNRNSVNYQSRIASFGSVHGTNSRAFISDPAHAQDLSHQNPNDDSNDYSNRYPPNIFFLKTQKLLKEP